MIGSIKIVHYFADALSIIFSFFAIYYCSQLIEKISGTIRSSFVTIRYALILIFVICILFTMEDFNLIDPALASVNLLLDFLVGIISLIIVFALAKINRVMEFMPASFFKAINNKF